MLLEQTSAPENNEKPEAPATGRPVALTGLFVMAVFYTIYLTRSFLLPIVLALLLTYLLAPLVRGLARLKIPRMLGAVVVLALLLAGIGLAVGQLIEPAANWIEKAPYSFEVVQSKIRPLKRPVEKVTQATVEIEKITEVPNDKAPRPVKVKGAGLVESLLKQTPAFLATLVTMLILLYFMLAYEDQFMRNIVRVMPTSRDKQRAIRIARDISLHVSRYLLTITAINIGLGLAIGGALFALGMPNPGLWGALACVLNFVPYLGAITGILALALAALLSFDNLAWASVFPGVYLLICSLEGNFITPMILGRSFTLNPIVLVIGLLFWTWMWGIPGTLLAVPILVTFRIFCEHIEALAPVRELLAGENPQK